MAVGFASYEIARSGLTFNERGLDVTGHNIANVNTLGYSRQQAIAADSIYLKNNAKYGYGQVGIGVDIQQTRQIRHKFLDNIYRFENAKANYWNMRSETFSEIENVLGEPLGEGIQALLNQFWNAWQELSKDPASLTTRSLVRQLGESLCFQLNGFAAQFDQMQLSLDSQFVDSIEQLNKMCVRVADLNKIIRNVQLTGEAPNDYMDERNLLLDEISQLIDCEIYERDDGMHDVISNGIYLVYRDTSKRIITQQSPELGLFHKASVVMVEGEPPILQDMVFGQCKLKGLLESRGEFMDMLDLNLDLTSSTGKPFDTTYPLNSVISTPVMFEKGSVTNGSPNTKTDVVIVIDLSKVDPGADYLADYMASVRYNIDNYVDGLLKKGLDVELKFVTINGTANGSADLIGEYNDVNDLISDVLQYAETGVFSSDTNTIDNLIDLLGDETKINYRENSNRYALLFTGESINGNANATSISDATDYARKLNELGMSLSVVTHSSVHLSGDGDPTEPFGWSTITTATGGAVIAYDETVGGVNVLRDFTNVMQDLNDFVNGSVNDRMSMIPASMQIIPDARKRINALINIICRSINELHRSGKTLESPPQDGEDFFVPINPKNPLEMGNIMINPKLKDPNGLNYIVSSTSGHTEDNNVALAIANLRNLPGSIKTVEGRTTFDAYYKDAMFVISNKASETERYLNNQITVAGSLDQMRLAIMGVSMDEELSNMMKFKFGYDSAARVLNVIDSMIETIVTRLGLGGR